MINDCPICLSENTCLTDHPDSLDSFDSSSIFKCLDCHAVWQEGYIILFKGKDRLRIFNPSKRKSK